MFTVGSRKRIARTAGAAAVCVAAVFGGAPSASATSTVYHEGGCRAQYGPDVNGSYLIPCASFDSTADAIYATVWYGGPRSADEVDVQLVRRNLDGSLGAQVASWNLGGCNSTVHGCWLRSPKVNVYDAPILTDMVYIESYWMHGVHYDMIESPKFYTSPPL